MTLPQLEALETRRMVSIRHARFDAALITAAIVNANRSAESDSVSPFDFLQGFERDHEAEEKEKLRKSIKHGIVIAMCNFQGTPEQLEAEKLRMVARMIDSGVEDPEQVLREVEEMFDKE